MTQLTMTEEAKIVLGNFAQRKRVHKDKLISIPKLFSYLTYNKKHKLDRANFDKVFEDLDRAGKGLLHRNKKGHLVHFLPRGSIRVLGVDELNAAGLPIPQGSVVSKPRRRATDTNQQAVVSRPASISNKTYTVLFKVKGLKCKAEIPEDAMDEFERLIG